MFLQLLKGFGVNGYRDVFDEVMERVEGGGFGDGDIFLFGQDVGYWVERFLCENYRR